MSQIFSRTAHPLRVRTRTTNFIARLLAELVLDLDATKQSIGTGAMSQAAYDTAWVAQVRRPDNCAQLAFPEAFDWLLFHQASDGSWSGPGSYALLPTMAGLLALVAAPPAYQTEATLQAAARARAYLEEQLRGWSVASHESVGFEVLAPGLLTRLEQQGGVKFEFSGKAELMALYHQKLALAGPELIYRGQSNLIHSLEAFGASLDWDKIKTLQAANGSYGCSPAATAAVLIYNPRWDQAATDWLTGLVQRNANRVELAGGMPNAYPIDAFEISWVIYNLLHATAANPVILGQRQFKALPQLVNWLRSSVGPKGASISCFGGLPTDSDDTGVVLAALSLADPVHGRGFEAQELARYCFSPFERPGYFACFEGERGESTSANSHVLAALLLASSTGLGSTPATGAYLREHNWVEESVTKIVNFLYSVRTKEGFWLDKWHLSPFYATASAVLALAEHPDPHAANLLRPTVQWVLQTQSISDGGWGGTSSSPSSTTLEETAYALQILQTLLPKPGLILSTAERGQAELALDRGLAYLWRRLHYYYYQPDQLPPLWRGKELYTPQRVVLSAALGVLFNALNTPEKEHYFEIETLESLRS
jgi:halimadienyl-diphosphate synthase